MSEQNANPVELFGMRVAHVGINAADPADALEIAELFSTMMGLPVIETPVSYFNDSLGRGYEAERSWHQGPHWLCRQRHRCGREVVCRARARGQRRVARAAADGGTKLVYFKREFAGFAVHLCRE